MGTDVEESLDFWWIPNHDLWPLWTDYVKELRGDISPRQLTLPFVDQCTVKERPPYARWLIAFAINGNIQGKGCIDNDSQGKGGLPASDPDQLKLF